MKQLILAILLVLALPVTAITNSHRLVLRCDALLLALEGDMSDADYSATILENWQSLRKSAAYSTPYDLVRNTNNACEDYLCRLERDDDQDEVDASLVQFKSCLHDLRRIHSMSLELIF